MERATDIYSMIQKPQTIGSNDNGFTLIELALVITVIGLLLSFGISAWMSMKTSQQISAANTALKTLSNCLINYTIHSGTIPPQAFFTKHCVASDPWGKKIVYYHNIADENKKISLVTTKVVKDATGDHSDTVWILVSSGPNKTVETISTASMWDCSPGDDLCHSTSKNTLIYEINK